jgi:hypothetical protein
MLLALALTLALAGCAAMGERVTVSPSEPHGKLVTGTSLIGQKVFPVQVTEVNGQRVSGPQGTMWLAPGEYEVRVSARFDTRHGLSSVHSQRLNQFGSGGRLTIEIEEGREYHVGAEIVGARMDRWQPVVFAESDIRRVAQAE